MFLIFTTLDGNTIKIYFMFNLTIPFQYHNIQYFIDLVKFKNILLLKKQKQKSKSFLDGSIHRRK